MRLSKTFGQTDKGYILFGFSKHGGLRAIWKGSRKATRDYSKGIFLSVASQLQSSIQTGAGGFFFSFQIYIFIQPLCHKPRKFLVSCETEELLNSRQAKWTFKKEGGRCRGNLALRRQVVTQGNWTHSRTLKPIKQTGAFLSFNQPYFFFFFNFLKIFIQKKKKTQKHRLLSLQYVVCCNFQFVQCFKAQGCLCFQLYMGLKHPSFWQAGRRLNKNQNRNKAD